MLLPGLASDAIPIGSFLSLNTWVDLRSGLGDPESLQRLISGAQGAGLFFGRKRVVDELVEKVERRTATNVVAVVGRSGTGKSSIVYAGLFPARCVASGASATSPYGGFSTCVPMTSRSINWRSPSIRQRRSRARWRGLRRVISPYGAGRRPYLIYAQSDFVPGRDF